MDPIKRIGQNPRVKYRTIRVREEVAVLLDEWRDIFGDTSISEVLYRIFALARRELRNVRDKKKQVKEEFVNKGNKAETLADLAKEVW
jgi:predicted CopG family antitoxin